MSTTRQRLRPHDPERHAATYVSGELSGRRRRWFESHLLDCEDCWREVLIGRLGRRLASDVRDVAPVALRDRIRASVEFEAAAPAQHRRARWWRRLGRYGG
jgi:anti-sigma factor RsiW